MSIIAPLRPKKVVRTALILPDLRGGGAERVAITIAKDLIEAGNEVDFVLLGEGGELTSIVPPGARIIELRAGRFRDAFRPLIRYFRQTRPEATQAFMWPITVLAILAHRLSGAPGRLAVSDHTTLSRHYDGHGPVHRVLLKWTIRLLYPLADSRVIVSNDAADDLARFSGIDRDSLTVIYNPVVKPTEPIRPMDDAWTGEGMRLLSVGKLKPVKNYPLLLEAFARVAAERPAQLMILGDGPERSGLMRRAAELGVADSLIMPGFALDPWPYYVSADLFVLSSDYEGYPLVLIEALLSGLNIVSTDCQSGPREILDGGRYGRLVPVRDAQKLAEGIAESLARPNAGDLLIERAATLTQGSFEAYRELMLGTAREKPAHGRRVNAMAR
jgi:glycosyltransferase involved in cell wall biosynthesis